MISPTAVRLESVSAFLWGAAIGSLGGLIGLGGAEFRLPVLLAVFAFAPLEAVILNKTVSLVVVASALPFRTGTVPWDAVFAAWRIIVNLLAGTLIGAWVGASVATMLRAGALRRVLAILLAAIAVVLLLAHEPSDASQPWPAGNVQAAAGVAAGLVIGVIAGVMGIAGGELLIPTLVLLFGTDVRLAGSLSLAISLPTMLTGFVRYSRDQTFPVVWRSRRFVLAMSSGSIVGAFLGGKLLGIVPSTMLLPTLALILVASAVKTWREGRLANGATIHNQHT
jgi:uncharacterized membrane protein YfcA